MKASELYQKYRELMQSQGSRMPFMNLSTLDCERIDAAEEDGQPGIRIQILGSGTRAVLINFKQLQEEYDTLVEFLNNKPSFDQGPEQ